MHDRPLILITNDDGFRAPGLAALRKALLDLGEVAVVAPAEEKSAVSHGITLHSPLRIESIEEGVWSVDGTPADCILVAMNKILKRRPDFVASGINAGANLGDDVNYSGTVAGAREGSMYGIRAAAFSLAFGTVMDYEACIPWVNHFASTLLQSSLNDGVFLNVNFPASAASDMKVTRQSGKFARSSIYENNDPRGKKYYWIGEDESRWDTAEDTDFWAVTNGLISVTPLHRDQTAHGKLATLRQMFEQRG